MDDKNIIRKKLARLIGPVIFLFVLLGAVFMFLGLEMSSAYTRESPDCSVWCVIKLKLLNLIH